MLLCLLMLYGKDTNRCRQGLADSKARVGKGNGIEGTAAWNEQTNAGGRWRGGMEVNAKLQNIIPA